MYSFRQRIDGKIYAIENCAQVFIIRSGHPEQNFSDTRVSILKANDGKYLLHKWGGALTQFAEKRGSTQYDGHELSIISPEEAQAMMIDAGADPEDESILFPLGKPEVV
jgi:hypothetical protein